MKEVIEIEVVLLPLCLFPLSFLVLAPQELIFTTKRTYNKQDAISSQNKCICLEVITLYAHMNINLHIVISIYE